MNATCEIQRLYERGIQFTLQPDASYGFLVGHGDYLHKAENTAVLPTFEQAVGWLMEQVIGAGLYQAASPAAEDVAGDGRHSVPRYREVSQTATPGGRSSGGRTDTNAW